MTNALPSGGLPQSADLEREFVRIYAKLNGCIDLEPALQIVTQAAKSILHCQSVAILLRHNDVYALRLNSGFPHSKGDSEGFFELETNSLSMSSSGQKLLEDFPQSVYRQVVDGTFDKHSPYFTLNGSFWCNNLSSLLAERTSDAAQSGAAPPTDVGDYGSFAVVAIPANGKAAGLIVLADGQGGLFSEGILTHLEMIADRVGLLIRNEELTDKLGDTEARFQSVLKAARDGIVILDATGRILCWNEEACNIFGYQEEEALGAPVQMIVDEGYRELIERLVAETAAKPTPGDKPQVVEILGCRRSGETFPVEFVLTPWKSNRIVFITGVFRDVTSQKEREKQLAHMATHDALTGLPNRTLFKDRLNVALAHAERKQERTIVILLDLDHFKKINDTFGHITGDKLLQRAGDRLWGVIRRSDTVGRMGGDEFLLLLRESADIEHANVVANKLLSLFKRPFIVDTRTIKITASMGLALYPDDGLDADTLIKNADIAMYRAKEMGRNNYQFFGAYYTQNR